MFSSLTQKETSLTVPSRAGMAFTGVTVSATSGFASGIRMVNVDQPNSTPEV